MLRELDRKNSKASIGGARHKETKRKLAACVMSNALLGKTA
jgi:hypothetical protein